MPPTPVSSTEIKGQDHSLQLSSLQMSFELPPSAIGPNDGSQAESSTPKTSPVSPTTKPVYPIQPSEVVKSRRRRSSAAQKEPFSLPPPPTRSRRIIQMKPKHEPIEQPAQHKATSTPSKNAGGSGTKRKQPSASSAAGRKIARKTAHSLIERRRRSKMNEEFAVLKDLIPACTGDMHKLAILQASIEYVRYLEDCITQLKSQRSDQSSAPTPKQFSLPSSNDKSLFGAEDEEEEEEDDDDEEDQEDVKMTNTDAASPAFEQNTSRSTQPPASPTLVTQDAQGRHCSYSSASTDPRHYSYSAPSNTASPAFGPQAYTYPTTTASYSAVVSPALTPQQGLDEEASAALLLLNVDRRARGSNGQGRGMSVQELLSS
ncbi:hypothetical protein F5B20DRAFT_581339 [Whalleya microplaca]|nr:hypothetical protein F5B20DRAFT_581339 [Whalleya microplaca]